MNGGLIQRRLIHKISGSFLTEYIPMDLLLAGETWEIESYIVDYTCSEFQDIDASYLYETMKEIALDLYLSFHIQPNIGEEHEII